MTSESRILQLYLAHRSALIGYATQIVGSQARAEDIVQETYLRFVARAEPEASSEESIHNPVGYLYRIVRNLALDWGRRSRTTEPVSDIPETMPAMVSSPEEDVLLRDEVRLVEKALAKLPDRTRLAFEMHRLYGYTLQETADKLGISVTRVHQMVRSALTQCAQDLDAAAEEPRERMIGNQKNRKRT